MKQHIYRFWFVGGIFLLCLNALSPTQAQIVEDATLPVNSAVDTSEDNVSSITGGTVAGRNLFHSFKQFNIDEGQTADFVSPSKAIQNILVRVTGGSSSKIEGKLSTSGVSKPNLFLINPSGIVFGPNASLEVGGSFVATTANAIEFGNQGLFSASTPNSPGLLTVNPSALFFNQVATTIENNSTAPAGFVEQSGLELSGLRVPDQRSLLLVGGNVTLDRGQLHALGGRIELGGLAGAGTVGLNVEDNNLRLSYPAGVPRANVSLTNGAVVDVTATGGGNIAINARNLDLETSVLQAGIGKDLQSDGTQAGDITLDTTEAMKIAGSSRITNNVESGAVGNAGNILIKADSLSLTDGAELSAVTFGQGNAGGISVQANKSISIASSLITTSPDEETGVGNGGDINIQTEDISLTDGSQIDTSIAREGRVGNVIINARNAFSVENSSISSDTIGPENAGIINIQAKELSLSKGAVISSLSATDGKGNAGNIDINASDINISGVSSKNGFSSGLVTSTEGQESGQGGDINVTTNALSVSDGAVLSARTRNASPGGDITVNTNTLEVTNGGQLLASAFSSGSAGNITVNATDSVTISGRDLTFDDRFARFSQIPGRIDNDGPASGLFARVRGDEAANAGGIKVTAGRFIRLDNQGTLTTETTLGEGGDITLKARDILLRHNSGITATAGTARAGGSGGNINIDSDLLFAVENSGITANAFQGQGGDIEINTQGLFLSPSSNITASSEFGLDGVVEINAPNVDLSRGLVNLPTVPVDTQVSHTCQPSRNQAQSEFVVTGRGGLPPSPDETLSSDAVQVDWVTLNPKVENRNQGVSTNTIAPEPDSIVEATRWTIANNGDVILTASAAPVLPANSWQTPAKCQAK
jgi:filamentous hemagglutinin family protein